jgi:hypothetical protein
MRCGKKKIMVEPDSRHIRTNMTLCMLDNKGYKQALTVCNTYCLSAATVLSRTHLRVSFVRTLQALLR